MTKHIVAELIQPGSFTDALSAVLRDGAQALLARVVEAEVTAFLARHLDVKTEDGRRRVVRHGHMPQREILTGDRRRHRARRAGA